MTKRVYLLFFLSGLAGLIYEIVWGRLFVFVFGSTTNSLVATMSAFMGGLALGSFVIGRKIDRLQVGASARFRADRHWRSIAAKVIDIDTTRNIQLADAMLDARHGGSIATQSGERPEQPIETLYRVRLALAEPLTERHETRGRVRIEGQNQSMAWELLKRVAAVVIRESGF